MTPGRAGYIRELLEKRVADLELGELRFLKSESGRQLCSPNARLSEVFNTQKSTPPIDLRQAGRSD